MRVVVIGAGIGGLCAAIGLQRAGADVTVYERAQKLGPVGSGLSIFGNGLTALDSLSIGSAVRSASIAQMAAFRGGQRSPDGRWLASIPSSAASDLRIVHRADLHAGLLGALAPGTLELGVDVTAVSPEGREVTTAAGTEEAHLVIAADGIRSAVRSSWPRDPGIRYSGYSTWRGVTAGPVDLGGEAGETWGRQERFGLAPLADGRVYWFAVASMPPNSAIADEYGEVRRRFATWHDPIPELIRSTESRSVFRLDINDLAGPVSTFVRGRCVLLGDAAHAMTPDLGQGANQAIEDAATLAALLHPLAKQSAPGHRLDDALARYDQLRRPRTQRIAKRARALGALAHTRSRLGVFLRDAVLRMTPPSALERQLASVQDWKPPTAG